MNGTNGNIVGLLERIVAELASMREGQSSMREELRDEMRATRLEVASMRRDLNVRIDNVIEFMGTHHSDLEQRVRVLEDHVLGKSG